MTYTVSELAEKVRRPGEDIPALIARLKNWGKMGLLKATGKPHPGQGRSRHYPESAVATARALSVLADIIGLPAVRSRSVQNFLAQTPKLFARAPAPGEPRFLVIGCPLDGVSGSLSIYREELLQEGLKSSPDPAHIVVDLKKYFQQLAIEEI